jgi:Na+-driven multidrug efflux pump
VGVAAYGIIANLSLVIISIYTGIFFGAEQIADIFNSEQNALLQSMAIEGLRLYFIACPFAGFNIIISMYYTSMDYPLPASIISILRGFIVVIPMAFVLSSAAKMTGVWCTFPATELLVAIVGVIFFAVHKNQ